MKQYSRVFGLLISVLIFCFQTANACSLDIPPLRKEFRRSKLVFLGKVTKLENYYIPAQQEKPDIPDIWRDQFTENKSKSIFTKVSFEINREWKGSLPKNKDFVAIAYWSCGCPGDKFDEFNVGEEYIIFASEKNFLTICDSFRQRLDGKPELTEKLNRFWFRAWARIYPF